MTMKAKEPSATFTNLSINKKEEVKMKGLFKKLEDIYASAAFAESGEADTAREILRDRKSEDKQLRKRTDKDNRPRLRAS